MSRPIRDTDPSKVHLITTRTRNAELLLVPHPSLNAITGGVLAKYTKLHSVDLFAYEFLSNHYHLLARAEEGVLPRFTADINRELAHRVNRLLNRKGTLWGRRYDDQITIEPCDALEGLLYVATNATKHGLVEQPGTWPGIHCYHQLLNEKTRKFHFFNYTKYHAAVRSSFLRGESVKRSDYEDTHELKLTPVPILSEHSKEERTAKLRELLLRKTKEIHRERKAAGKGYLGRKNVLLQPREGVIPREVSNSPRPVCYTKSLETLKVARTEVKRKRAAYSVASYRYRCGNLETIFPEFCFKPPTHYAPNEIPLGAPP